MNRLKAKYNEEIIPSLREEFNYENDITLSFYFSNLTATSSKAK